MKVSDSNPGNLIAIRNLFGIREFYLITKKQDNPFKVLSPYYLGNTPREINCE